MEKAKLVAASSPQAWGSFFIQKFYELVALVQKIETAKNKHNAFLKELGLPLLP
ncbi:hypothetical protein [Nitrosomonas eutropha]|uniref:hypothetical protein n=1 Tax=Nitrosomonas eutropha TaxID=916 RepID=UPI003F743657